MDSKPNIKPLVAAVVAWLVASAGCAAGGTTRHEFSLFSISVPTGWTHVAHNAKSAERGPGARFEGPAGEYLDIEIDVGTDFFDADAWWKVMPKSDGSLVVEGKVDLCPQGPPEPSPEIAPGVFGIPLPSCLAGDGRLDAELNFEARGHGYVIWFGNTKRERAEDLKPFKAILATFKAK
jgi:hypothetical protein